MAISNIIDKFSGASGDFMTDMSGMLGKLGRG